MDTAAERIFGFVRGATREHIRMDLRPRSDKAQSQKDLSPKGFIKNRAVPTGRDCSSVEDPSRIFSFVAPRRRPVFDETAVSIVF
jgi:hypothetical protein